MEIKFRTLKMSNFVNDWQKDEALIFTRKKQHTHKFCGLKVTKKSQFCTRKKNFYTQKNAKWAKKH